MKTIYSLWFVIASLFIFECNSTGPVTNTTGNAKVVWVGYDGNDNEIYSWDGNSVTQITDNDYNDAHPQLSGKNVVWMGSSADSAEIYFWDGNTIKQITDNDYVDRDPQISDIPLNVQK